MEQDERVIAEFLKFKNEEYQTHKYFTDGASSKVMLLNGKYLIKQNTKETLKAEIEFLKGINENLAISDFFQKIEYINSDFEFVVYDFIEGSIMKNPNNVKGIEEKLLIITSNYLDYNKDGFGYLGEGTSSWEEFLKQEIEDSSENIKDYIENSNQAISAVEALRKYEFDKKLLHGDFGTHNFVERDGLFIGVIDPMPVIGDKLYDLLFAICSNVSILQKYSLEDIYGLVEEPKEKVKALFTVVLYSRISRCLKYHPKDINIYMNYWKELKNK